MDTVAKLFHLLEEVVTLLAKSFKITERKSIHVVFKYFCKETVFVIDYMQKTILIAIVNGENICVLEEN